jgi:tripartite-type tricarboxylate transporter receptor subunit TctC
MAHVPYKGGGQAIIDVIAGHVQVGFINILEASAQIKSERLRALAVTTAQRSPVLPGVPTVAESGLTGYEVTQWSGMLAPAGTPPAIIARLNAEIDKIMQKPLVRERLAADGAQPGGGSPEKFGTFIKADIAKWSKVVKSAGLVRQ